MAKAIQLQFTPISHITRSSPTFPDIVRNHGHEPFTCLHTCPGDVRSKTQTFRMPDMQKRTVR